MAYLIPFLALGAMIVMIVYLARNTKSLSDALGSGIARRKRQTRKNSLILRFAVWIGFWGLALGALYWRCGGIFCTPGNQTQTLPETVAATVGNGTTTGSPVTLLQGPALALANIVGSSWFLTAFFGLLVVSSVIVIRGLIVSRDETKAQLLLVREEGMVAVQDALKSLETMDSSDPRTRIMNCYEKMIRAAGSLGADVRVDQTARELEWGIRDLFQLKGRGIADLTRLFEEARYSLHPITEMDSQHAQKLLLEIGDELKESLSVDK